jgi:hypothetical protein
MYFTNWISWIYSFFIPVLPFNDIPLATGEMHGSVPKQESVISNKTSSSETKEEVDNTKIKDILHKIKEYDILGEKDYEYMKSLHIVKKAEWLRNTDY